MTDKIGCGVLIEINELDLDYIEQDYTRMKGQKRGHVRSRSLRVMLKLHMTLSDIIKTVKGNYMLLGLIYFHIHSFLLIYNQVKNTED